jgi:hypothetical protein
LAPASRPEQTMCEKCAELDKAIARYQNVQRFILDKVTVDRAIALIAELEHQKLAFHPEETK